MKQMFLKIFFILISIYSINANANANAEDTKSENVVIKLMPFNSVIRDAIHFSENNYENYKPINGKEYATPLDITSDRLKSISRKDYWLALFDNYFKNQGFLNQSYQKDLTNSYSKYFIDVCTEKNCKNYNIIQDVNAFVSKNEEFAYAFFYKVKEIKFIPLYFNEITRMLGLNVLLFNVKTVDGDYTSLVLTNFDNLKDFGSGFIIKSIDDKYIIEMEDQMADNTGVSKIINLLKNVYDISYAQYNDSWNRKKIK